MLSNAGGRVFDIGSELSLSIWELILSEEGYA